MAGERPDLKAMNIYDSSARVSNPLVLDVLRDITAAIIGLEFIEIVIHSSEMKFTILQQPTLRPVITISGLADGSGVQNGRAADLQLHGHVGVRAKDDFLLSHGCSFLQDFKICRRPES